MYNFNNFIKKYWKRILLWLTIFLIVLFGLWTIYIKYKLYITKDIYSTNFMLALVEGRVRIFLHTSPGFYLFIFVLGLLCFAFITIWTRAVGPRVRLDQLSKLTWRFILLLIYILIVLLVFFYSVV